MRPRPGTLLLAAAAQAIEAAGVLLAAVLTAVDTAAGRSYEQSSGIALTVIAFAAAAFVALVAVGIFRVRRWSRTPALLTQLFVGTTGVYLLEGHRLAWGLPALLLAVAGFLGLLLPPSLRAIGRPGMAERETLAAPPASPAPPAPQTARPAGSKTQSRRR